jgi:hypothetical protein
MLELIHEYPDTLRAGASRYRARAYGARDESGTWEGYVVFVPVGGGRVIATGRETTQSTLDALVKWSGTLSWVYLEGALERARERQPEVQLARRLAEIERIEAEARAEADALARAAESARQEAAAAQEDRRETERALAAAAAATAEASAAFHEQVAAQARSEARAAQGARVAYEHAIARAEEAAASRVAEEHEEAAIRARAAAAEAGRRSATPGRRRRR